MKSFPVLRARILSRTNIWVLRVCVDLRVKILKIKFREMNYMIARGYVVPIYFDYCLFFLNLIHGYLWIKREKMLGLKKLN